MSESTEIETVSMVELVPEPHFCSCSYTDVTDRHELPYQFSGPENQTMEIILDFIAK